MLTPDVINCDLISSLMKMVKLDVNRGTIHSVLIPATADHLNHIAVFSAGPSVLGTSFLAVLNKTGDKFDLEAALMMVNKGALPTYMYHPNEIFGLLQRQDFLVEIFEAAIFRDTNINLMNKIFVLLRCNAPLFTLNFPLPRSDAHVEHLIRKVGGKIVDCPDYPRQATSINPLSLAELARIKIRRSLPLNNSFIGTIISVRKLGLPHTLCDFVMFKLEEGFGINYNWGSL